ncbi:ECF transporter S component [Agromyces sp. LHK192]|uniref:ECF transporter S component n=1 Tax=Agromyces sp. LHK192 TaxID=2498704 RepID=UPI0013E3F306|nr:ECF transporter S component [Agromyces sp. LHK192]
MTDETRTAPRTPRTTRTSTRFLLAVAAIGVAGGLLNIGNAYFFNVVAVAMPALAGLGTGVYTLPVVVAQAATRRAGAAVLASLIAGLTQAPFVPGGIGSVASYLIIGVLIEAVFAIARYRVWRPWLHYVATLVVVVFYSVFWGAYWNLPSLALPMQIAIPGVLLVTQLAFTWLGLVIAGRLARTGVLRGLRRDTAATPAAPNAPEAPEGTPDGQVAQ